MMTQYELALIASVALHAAALAIIPPHDVGSQMQPPLIVELTLPKPEPEVPEREPRPAEPTPEPPSPEPTRPVRPTPAPKPEPSPHRPAAISDTEPAASINDDVDEPVDLTAMTLTGNGGFSIRGGSGAETRGSGTARGSGAAATQPTAPLVAAVDLSERPRAPDLDDQLWRHYPAAARQRGLAGQALVNAVIDTDGVVRSTQLVSQTAEGFGDACQRTLRDSKWTPPRDRAGQHVRTQIKYRCEFRVDR